jgi:hypothetical protein
VSGSSTVFEDGVSMPIRMAATASPFQSAALIGLMSTAEWY